MKQSTTTRRPIRVYVPDPDLNTTRRRNVAWRLTCKVCGTSATGRYPSAALAKLNGHDCSPDSPATLPPAA